MLKVSNLTVNYGHIAALKGISFEVGEGKIVALIGANGAGKTTTVMAISCLLPKTTGNILLMGEDITHCRPDSVVKKGIAHVPEGRLVFPNLSVKENLIMGTISDRNLAKAVIEERIEEKYGMFPRLKERNRQLAGTLSGGEQQMLAIARGLMMKPKLIMLDEPSLGLAPIIVEEIFELIGRLRDAGTTVLLIEQNAMLAIKLCDYAYALELGEIFVSGTGEELLNSEEVRKAYLGA